MRKIAAAATGEKLLGVIIINIYHSLVKKQLPSKKEVATFFKVLHIIEES